MSDFTTGHQTVFHDDGSVTTYTVEHEPYTEPLSTKATILIYGGTLGVTVLFVALPAVVGAVLNRFDDKKVLRDRQKKNKEIFHQLKPV